MKCCYDFKNLRLTQPAFLKESALECATHAKTGSIAVDYSDRA